MDYCMCSHVHWGMDDISKEYSKPAIATKPKGRDEMSYALLGGVHASTLGLVVL